MSYSTADVDRLDRAIASGALRVEVDGQIVLYRSIDELKSARALIQDTLATAAGAPPVRLLNPILTNGLRRPWFGSGGW